MKHQRYDVNQNVSLAQRTAGADERQAGAVQNLLQLPSFLASLVVALGGGLELTSRL